MRIASWLFAMAVLAALGLTGIWIGLFAEPDRLSGGLPFVPRHINVLLARMVFTLGGLVCLALLLWGLRLGPEARRSD